jgi:BirA family biotin operon repressor/biotin-[acetyl-CoA-carboxylase] ligase
MPEAPAWPEGVGRVIVDETESSMAEARRLSASGVVAPFWVMARHQTQGRGRQGRVWRTIPGNFAGTCLMRPAMPPAQRALLSFAACLAVAELFEAVAPGVPVTMKWPNDALLDGRKAAGVLLEGWGEGGDTTLLIGIGINLAAAPPRASGGWEPTAVAAVAGHAPTPEQALDILAPALHRWSVTLQSHGFAPLRRAWLARAARLGEKIVARLPNETVEGVFSDLDAQGALVLSQDGRERRIHAADVFFG